MRSAAPSQPPSPPSLGPPGPAGRDLALDALRGLMILVMVLVNHPLPGLPTLAALTHAPWHGWTLADVVFPGFLFAVGISIRLTLCDAQGRPRALDAALARKLARRFAGLLLLDFLLVNFPYYFAGTLHFSGTLALIAWCSLGVSLIVLCLRPRAQLVCLLGLLAVQWAALAWWPLPGAPAGTLSEQTNAARHLYELAFGTGGAAQERSLVLMGLPTLGAWSSTLIGALAAPWVVAGAARAWPAAPGARAASALVTPFAAGLTLIAAGWAWHTLLPINMTLWTGSYAVFMAGIALCLLALLQAAARAEGVWRAALRALQVAGANALFVYVFAQALQRVLVYARVPDGAGATIRLRHWIAQQFFPAASAGEWAICGALVYLLVFASICWLAAWVLYRRGIFLKL